MNGDEYIALLQQRQADWIAASTVPRPSWVVPLLDWFVRPGDEQLFAPPPETRQPKRQATPRTYRSAASLRAERERLIERQRPLVAPLSPDRAASGGEALGQRRTARMQAQEDGRLQKYVVLDRRIKALDSRIARAEAREARP